MPGIGLRLKSQRSSTGICTWFGFLSFLRCGTGRNLGRPWICLLAGIAVLCASPLGATAGASSGSSASTAGYSDIFDAARRGKPETVRAFLSEGGKATAVDGSGITCLMYAAWFNPDPAVLEVILDAGASPDYGLSGGFTPVMLAAWNENPEVVELLAARGANLKKTDAFGTNSLMLAARYNRNPLVVRKLVELGMDVRARSSFGWSALMFAAQSNPVRAVTATLLDLGADASVEDGLGRTAISLSAENPNPEIVQLLAARASRPMRSGRE